MWSGLDFFFLIIKTSCKELANKKHYTVRLARPEVYVSQWPYIVSIAILKLWSFVFHHQFCFIYIFMDLIYKSLSPHSSYQNIMISQIHNFKSTSPNHFTYLPRKMELLHVLLKYNMRNFPPLGCNRKQSPCSPFKTCKGWLLKAPC